MTPPKGEFADALAIADMAMQPVLGDPAIWAAEAARTDAAALPWPLQMRGEGYPQLLRLIAYMAVEAVLRSMREQQGAAQIDDDAMHEIVHALDTTDPEVQTVLRVVDRAVQAADAAMRDEYATTRGGYRLSGKREFANWVKACAVASAMQPGVSRAEALAKLPFSRAAAYRAMALKRR